MLIIPSAIFTLAFLGINFNLAFSHDIIQPDWSLSLLMASLLARRNNYLWVLPVCMIHDAIFYWSFFVTLPWMICMPLAMLHFDRQLGPGLLHRLIILLLSSFSIYVNGWSMQTWWLTLFLTIPVWYILKEYYERTATGNA